MPLAWPLSAAEFFDTLPIRQVTFHLGRSVTTSQTGGGDLIAHQLGTRLWQGQIILGKDHHRAAAAIEARLALLEEAGASLLIYDPRLPGPIADPDGSLLGGSTPRIASLRANNRQMTLKNLPTGYEISQGDVLGFSYGSNPVRTAYHRVVTGGVAPTRMFCCGSLRATATRAGMRQSASGPGMTPRCFRLGPSSEPIMVRAM